jgi:acylphosphatase
LAIGVDSIMLAKRYFLSGRVQGVAFRYFTERVAHRLGIKGYVCNLWDGRVEAFAQGDEESLNFFYEKLKEGPPAARVDRIEVIEETPDQKLQSFHVKF